MSLEDKLLDVRLRKDRSRSDRFLAYVAALGESFIPGWFNFVGWILIIAALHVLERLHPSLPVAIAVNMSYWLLGWYLAHLVLTLLIIVQPEPRAISRRWWLLAGSLSAVTVFAIDRIVRSIAVELSKDME